MSHDFDKLTDRRGSNSLKWDITERELPMWVADMDFETAPEITEALKNGRSTESSVIPRCRRHGGRRSPDGGSGVITLKWIGIGLYSAPVWCPLFPARSVN